MRAPAIPLRLSFGLAEVRGHDRRRHALAGGVLEIAQAAADPLDHKDALRLNVAAAERVASFHANFSPARSGAS